MADPTTTLLLTRPRDAAERFAARLAADLPDSVRVVISPLLEIVPTGRVPDLSTVAGVIFASANGVRMGGAAQALPAYCVGPNTTEAARHAGWAAQQAGQDADSLVAQLIASSPATPLLHIAPVHKRGDIAQRLSAAGLPTDTVDVYDQQARNLTDAALAALRGPGPVVAPLMSPRTAALFAMQAPDRPGLHLVAMSDAVVEELTKFPLAEITCAASPDGENMRSATLRALGRVEDRGVAH